MKTNLIKLFIEADYTHCFFEIDYGFFFDHIEDEKYGVNPNRIYKYKLDQKIIVLK